MTADLLLAAYLVAIGVLAIPGGGEPRDRR
jgi:hypothetical protein